MRNKFLILCLVIAAPGIAATDAPQPQPAAPGGSIAAAKAQAHPLVRVIASPAIMQTTAVRMPDGSIATVCEQKPNPKAGAIAPNQPLPEPQQ